MGARFLHLADLHLDRVFAGTGCHGELARRRRRGLRDALRRAGQVAIERGCDAITLGGDVYEHDRADADTGLFLAETFAAWAPLRVLVAPGNHDPVVPGSIWSRTAWPENVHVFTEAVLRPVEVAGITVWGLAHREHTWQGDPLTGGPGRDAPGVHVALFHGAELGSRPAGKSVHGPFRAERIREAGFVTALCGHYHRRRIDERAGLVYPGTPEPLGFDDEGERGPVLVEVDDDGTVRYQPLALNAWHVVSTEAELDGCTTATSVHDRACASAIASTGTLPAERTLLRLRLTGDVSTGLPIDVDQVEEAVREASGLAHVTVTDATEPAVDVAAAALDRTARGAFTRGALAALEACADDEERAVLTDALRYGLQALSGVEVGLR